ncbi:ATP-dependent Clp protease ATP-binding subunit ClpA-like, chloroplastic [Quillaja saponaria]|uniref:ATP-dependent Clp protease ATP-binding subunit ClpA-like, chloroplastic n=1 Tax=Quillaja saponaria TaxID=32244 RepID=A0AAD7PMB0_QUISA|nr:ATP-dependent Clp protease ATP-binding subunit ClpA-like, chloroplastic [Quillaja saponaria]
MEKVSSEESECLLKMEETPHKYIIGQDEAVNAISNAIRCSRDGLRSPKKPIASFLFTDATGVGKTELAKTIARCSFGLDYVMARFEMSACEFQENHTESKFIGSPSGYHGYEEGGQLKAVRRQPHTVVLFLMK